jgi:hypothetical protein
LNHKEVDVEIWKDIPGWVGSYQASNTGKIKSLDKTIKSRRGSYLKTGRILKESLCNNGYFQVDLSNKGKRKKSLVHRLVLKAFKGDFEMVINHMNCIKTDNRIENIEYTTQKENIQHSIKNGLQKRRYGESTGSNKLKTEQVNEIKKLLKANKKQKDIAKSYNVCEATISDIKNNKTWVTES